MGRKPSRTEKIELDYAKKSIALRAAEKAAHQTLHEHLLSMADLLVARDDADAARIKIMRLLRGRKSR